MRVFQALRELCGGVRACASMPTEVRDGWACLLRASLLGVLELGAPTWVPCGLEPLPLEGWWCFLPRKRSGRRLIGLDAALESFPAKVPLGSFCRVPQEIGGGSLRHASLVCSPATAVLRRFAMCHLARPRTLLPFPFRVLPMPRFPGDWGALSSASSFFFFFCLRAAFLLPHWFRFARPSARS